MSCAAGKISFDEFYEWWGTEPARKLREVLHCWPPHANIRTATRNYLLSVLGFWEKNTMARAGVMPYRRYFPATTAPRGHHATLAPQATTREGVCRRRVLPAMQAYDGGNPLFNLDEPTTFSTPMGLGPSPRRCTLACDC